MDCIVQQKGQKLVKKLYWKNQKICIILILKSGHYRCLHNNDLLIKLLDFPINPILFDAEILNDVRNNKESPRVSGLALPLISDKSEK